MIELKNVSKKYDRFLAVEDINIKIDELTESGKVYTFNNKGMKDIHGRRGTYAVKVEYEMPKKLTPELKKALKNLK